MRGLKTRKLNISKELDDLLKQIKDEHRINGNRLSDSEASFVMARRYKGSKYKL